MRNERKLQNQQSRQQPSVVVVVAVAHTTRNIKRATRACCAAHALYNTYTIYNILYTYVFRAICERFFFHSVVSRCVHNNHLVFVVCVLVWWVVYSCVRCVRHSQQQLRWWRIASCVNARGHPFPHSDACTPRTTERQSGQPCVSLWQLIGYGSPFKHTHTKLISR